MQGNPSPIAGPIIGDVRHVIQETIKHELANVPTTEAVQAMIDRSLAPVKENFEAQIRSIDTHLRESERQLSSSARGLEKATDRFNATSDRFESHSLEWSKILGSLTESNRQSEVKGDEFRERIRALEAENREKSKELRLAIERATALHHDVHGDPNEPHSKSIQQVINENHQTIMQKFEAIQKRLDEHDEYIQSRRNFEARAQAAIAWVWDQKVGKALIVTNIILAVGGVFNLWPSVVDALFK